ncbi:hypothetical protein A3717_12095 [Alcanivorax sp. HI0013]|nr:hypothetical protein A3714_08320 [Alcanivorax sp. HI0007]KZX77607.1 hypothetical protein A3717_12095 [Alcanivorax sp. HI0013]
MEKMARARISDTWFDEFFIPENFDGLKRIEKNGFVFLLSGEGEEVPLTIVSSKVLKKIEKPKAVFDRIMQVSLASFSSKVSIPKSWGKYVSGSCFSIYAYPKNNGEGQRVYFDRVTGREILHVYNYKEAPVEFSDVDKNEDVVNSVIDAWYDILTSDSLSSSSGDVRDIEGDFGIVLDDTSTMDHVASASLEDWCNYKLTDQQRKFVEAGLSAPIRLRGAAGTGKTLCMVIKSLKEIIDANNDGRSLRIAFLTHSESVAHDVVSPMISILDPEGRRASNDKSCLWVGSLYELAKDFLNYKSKKIVPISLDGIEGRQDQLEYIKMFIGEVARDPYVKESLLPKASEWIRDAFLGNSNNEVFVSDLMNEISSILDPEGINKNKPDKVQRYVANEKRSDWQMSLPKRSDREIVIEVYDKYYRSLSNENIISLDQMIADLVRYLGSNTWGYEAEERGFDLVFVDELHQFNHLEREVFHELFRNKRNNTDGKLPIFMAYDLKQSHDDRFLSSGVSGGAARFFQTINVGKTDLIELTKIFRSTPEISAFLSNIDGCFPALDLGEEWVDYTGDSKLDSGEKPTLYSFPKNSVLIDKVVGEAHRHARRIGSGKNVAVLCMNEELFSTYANAGRIAKKIVVIDSERSVKNLQYAGKRCVLSMPDFVAGLQFDVVYIIHIDKADMSDEESLGRKRRFLSRLYLGASRASKVLNLVTSRERGGQPEMLESAFQAGIINKSDI